MPKKSITRNYLYNLAYQILILVLPLVTTPYLARVLGAEGTGIYSYTYTIVNYFVLFGSLRRISVWTKRNCICTAKKTKEKENIFRINNI